MKKELIKTSTQSLIGHLTQNKPDYLSYKLAVREAFFVESIPNYCKAISTGTSLRRLKETLGIKEAVKIVSSLLTSFCKGFNVAKNMNEEQIVDYAIHLIESNQNGSAECPSLRIEDLMIFFELAKFGKFGQVKVSLDGQVVEMWLDSYFEQSRDEWQNEEKKQIHNDDFYKQVETDANLDRALAIKNAITRIRDIVSENIEEDKKTEAERIEQNRKERVDKKKKDILWSIWKP